MTLEDQQTPTPEDVSAPEQVQEQVAEVTPEVAPQQTADDAAFEQGFNSVDGAEDPAPEPVPEPPKFAGYTEAEIKDMAETVKALSSREAKIFGTMGSLKQQVDYLRNQPAPQQASERVTLDKLKRLHAEYPDLAEAIAADFGGLSLGSAAPAFNQDEIARVADQVVQSRLAPMTQTYEQRLLAVKHSDWRDVALSPEFVAWKETLPQQEKQYLDTTWDSAFVGQKLSEFKDWKNKAVQNKQTNQRRLEAAITPRGNPQRPPASSAEEEFIKGFNALGPVR